MVSSRKAVVYNPNFFYNSNTCQMYRQVDYLLTRYSVGFDGTVATADRREILTFPVKPDLQSFDRQVQSPVNTTRVINDSTFMSGNGFVYLVSKVCNGENETITVGVKNSDGVPLPWYFVYDISYKLPVSVAELRNHLDELLNYTASNYDSLTGELIKFNASGEPTSLPNAPAVTACANGFDLSTGAIAGLVPWFYAGTPVSYFFANSGDPIFGDLTAYSDQCGFKYGGVRFTAWFSKVQLTQNYQVETIALSSQTPSACPAIAPLGDLTLTCSTGGVVEKTDGFGDTGQPRAPLFGPISFAPHYTLTRCRF